jgi:hypothetical protein
MQFADLTDTLFSFQCQPSDDKCHQWDYDFSIETWDDKYLRNLSKPEITYLKENCKRILQVLNNLPRRVK